MTSKRRFEIASYVLFIALILVLPAFLGEFWLNRIAKYLVFGMLGVAICLSWGYAGILNLGQGLFFGLGAYAMAMSLKLASNTSMQQGSETPIPDFMFWNAEPGAKPDLCCITKTSFLWIPFQNQWVGFVMAIIVPTIVAAILGAVIFRKRIAGVFISIITLALVLLARLLVIDGQPLTNGFNGLTDLGSFTIGDLAFDSYSKATYYVVAVALALVLVCTRLLVETRAGLVLQAVRDDANRARYLGFDVPNYQVFFFAVSAAIAGLGRPALRQRRGVRVPDLPRPLLLDHHGGLGRGRRARFASRRLHRRDPHQHGRGWDERDTEPRRILASHHRPHLHPRRPVPAARPRRSRRRHAGHAPGASSRSSRRDTRARRRARQLQGRLVMAVALTLDGLGVDFSGFKAVTGVSTTVEDGELRVLLGANGAGKTTLMDLISGRTASTEGRVFLFDREITNRDEHVIARAGLGRKFQIPSVFKELSVRRNLEVASCPGRGVFSNLRFGFPKASRDRLEEVLDLVASA